MPETVSNAEQVQTESHNYQYRDPYEFLATVKNAPSKQQIEAWKSEVPGGRVRLFTPDGKRVYIIRGISGLELAKLADEIPANAKDVEYELKLAIAARCVLWTNATPTGVLDVYTLRTGPAGLPETIHTIVSQLSDYFDPVQLASFSADL